jgi:hypothetical protein
MRDTELVDYLELVRSTASGHGLTMFPGTPFQGQRYRDLVFDGDLHQFISFAIVARTHFLYLDARYLDVEAEIATRVEARSASEQDVEETAFINGIFSQAAKPWRDRNGSLHTVAVTFVVEGICHKIVEAVDWLEEFTNTLEEANASLEQRVIQRRRDIWAQRVRTLLADPRFALARNENQRIRLAEELNPGMTESPRALVTSALTETWFHDATEESGM